jgi:hypothetical protein
MPECSRCHKQFEADGHKNCLPCRKYGQEWTKKNKARKRAVSKKWWSDHKDKWSIYAATYREKHPDRVAEYQHSERNRKLQRERRARDRLVVLQHYAKNAVPSCSCCGEDLLEFLCIDHTNGNGNEHRRELKNKAVPYRWFIKQDFPDGFRVLCYNCNQSLGAYGYCPHTNGG